ncbi:Cof-type HAD-IIB family hydrolase [[Mycoplasma] testudinis]|uniref:Cof-type HAD-IIB family hydrolase n=1 Tax=[Mycoplasma] testudinis TaxID=33924 RepID=UPI0004875ECB|nr:Cof-type HAD-IIB family hydrolase [[Mycoplasma] testudinis]
MDWNLQKIIEEVRYWVFDLDGTLITDKHNLHEFNLEIPELSRKYNIDFTIITGRPVYMMRHEISQLRPTLPVVGSNGSILVKDQKVVWAKNLDDQLVKNFVSDLRQLKMNFYAYSPSAIYVEPYHFFQVDRWRKSLLKIPPEFRWKIKGYAEFEQIWDERITKFLVCTSESNKLRELIAKKYSKQLFFAPTKPNSIDVGDVNVNKGTGLTQIMKMLGNATPNQFLVFGDGGNDLPIFKIAKYSVAVDNAPDFVKKQATFVAPADNNNGGVVRFIKNLWTYHTIEKK